MKIITKLFLSLCLVLGLGATLTSNAQIESDASIRANIPHSFVVHNKTLPPGTYTITVPDVSSDLNVMEIRSVNDKVAVLFNTEPINAVRIARHSELVFEKIGDNYFLSQVFLKGDEGGNQLPKSKKERRLEQGGAVAERYSISAEPMSAKAAKQTAGKMD